MKETIEQKSARNARVQSRYDALMIEGRHGHYETMFRVVREEVEALHEEIGPLRATLGIALAALEYHRDQTRPIALSDEAITALQTALTK